MIQLDRRDNKNKEVNIRLLLNFARVLAARAQRNYIIINIRYTLLKYNKIDYYILAIRN